MFAKQFNPFCGCGTAVHAARNLNRQWIGIDITHHAEHPDHAPDLNFKKAKTEPHGKQNELL
jgi:adenine specific DNA methylase Mod